MFAHSATINYDDGWIRFEPGYRLDKEEYAAVTKAGLNWKRAEQCFVAPWAPTIEDFLRQEFSVALEPDNTDLLAVARGRAAYYQQYSDNAAARSQSARKSADALSERFAFGQPILVGHHSEKGARRDKERIAANMDKAIAEGKKAAKWDDRAQATLSHAAARYTAIALARRIEKLQADMRGHQRTIQQFDDIETVRQKAPKLADKLMETFFFASMTPEQMAASRVFHERWIAFLQARLDVAQALYDESEGLAKDKELPLEIGGAVEHRGRYWYPVTRVNQKSVTVSHWLGVLAYKIPLTDITAAKGREEWEQTPKRLAGGIGYLVIEPVKEKGNDHPVQE
ncbi:MAG: DUF3560 domain-containing protein [Chloroflexi bacterium]|nr:DUF3560 domain-containing protein [Chloroflexota bacterium]